MFGQNDFQNQQPDNNANPAGTPADPTPGTNPFANFGNAAGVPAVDDNAAVTNPEPSVVETVAQTAPAEEPRNDDLLNIKQEALQHLTPLVNHLEQSPEEKFRTVMMMIQASDDHTKLKEAFDAAKQIADDKARAQALLDVINEINYFTQQHN